MKRLYWSTRGWISRGLSVVLIASLTAPSLFGVLPPMPARAAPPMQTASPQQAAPAQAELSAPRAMQKFAQALQHLIEANDESRYQAAASAVDAAWHTLALAVQQLQARLDAQAQTLSATAGASQNEMRATLSARFGEVTAHYQS